MKQRAQLHRPVGSCHIRLELPHPEHSSPSGALPMPPIGEHSLRPAVSAFAAFAWTSLASRNSEIAVKYFARGRSSDPPIKPLLSTLAPLTTNDAPTADSLDVYAEGAIVPTAGLADVPDLYAEGEIVLGVAVVGVLVTSATASCSFSPQFI